MDTNKKMRLSTVKKLIFPAIILIVGGMQMAAGFRQPSSHFRTGEYKLTKGKESLCGGIVMNHENNANGRTLVLTSSHMFRTQASQNTITDSQRCNNITKNEVSHKRRQSIYSLNIKRVCNNGQKVDFTLNKKATVTKKGISMTFTQTGDYSNSYTCVWTRVK